MRITRRRRRGRWRRYHGDVFRFEFDTCVRSGMRVRDCRLVSWQVPRAVARYTLVDFYTRLLHMPSEAAVEGHLRDNFMAIAVDEVPIKAIKKACDGRVRHACLCVRACVSAVRVLV